MNISKSEKNRRAKQLIPMILDEIETMKREHARISISDIADRLSIDRKKLYAPNIRKAIVERYPELEVKKRTPKTATENTEKLRVTIFKKQEEIDRLRITNSNLHKQIKDLKEKYNAIQKDYKLLLGKYYLLDQDKHQTF